MQEDRKTPQQGEQQQIAIPQTINLDEYAGDEEDDAMAKEQSRKYIQDVDRGVRHQDDKTSERGSERERVARTTSEHRPERTRLQIITEE